MSVIIPTLGRYDDLRRCFAALEEAADLVAATRSTEIDVVVAGDGCELDPERIPCRLPLRLLSTGRRIGAQAARQFACRSSDADIFAFVDDDAMPRGDWFRVILESVPTRAVAITGRVLPMDSRLLSRARQARYDQRYGGLRDGDPVGFFAGGNSAILAGAFRSVGGFSRMGTGGDNSLCEALDRVGTPVRFASGLVVVHRHDKGLRAAAVAAITAGLGYQQRLPLRSAWHDLGAPAPGDSSAVRLVNRVLASANTVARALPRARRFS